MGKFDDKDVIVFTPACLIESSNMPMLRSRRAWSDTLFNAYDEDSSGMIMLDEFAPLIFAMEPDVTLEEIRLTFLGAGGEDGLDKNEFYDWNESVLGDFDDHEYEEQMKAMMRTAASLTDNMARRRVLLAACDDDVTDG